MTPMLQPTDRRLAVGLLVLRLTSGLFLVLWSLEKFVVPDATIRIAHGFYGMTLPSSLPIVIGTAELALSLALCLGLYQVWSYGIALLINSVTVIVSWRQLLDPWGLAKIGTHIWIATIPTWGGFLCLFLARAADTLSLDAWWQRRA